jgi:hypothetical protein
LSCKKYLVTHELKASVDDGACRIMPIDSQEIALSTLVVMSATVTSTFLQHYIS